MFLPAEDDRTHLKWRVVLWFTAVLLAAVVFVLVLTIVAEINSPTRTVSETMFVAVTSFVGTLTFELPVSLLFLPLIIFFRSNDKWQRWILLVSGALIGPLVFAVWTVVLMFTDRNKPEPWAGGPPHPTDSTLPFAIPAFIVGTLATVVYILFLRIFCRGIRAGAPAAQ